MNPIVLAGGMPLDVGVASRPFGGATVSGDQYTICKISDGVLIVVVDGLGHGHEAAAAAHLAIATIEASPDQSLPHLFKRCNDAITYTRGVVMTAATINTVTQLMMWAAIGNVDAGLFRASTDGQRKRHSIVMVGGVVGSRIPSIRSASHRIEHGDTLVFATDGVHPDFGDRFKQTLSPQAQADDILHHRGKITDDALVVVARWLGGDHS